MDANIVNYPFLKSTAQDISKLASQGYIKKKTFVIQNRAVITISGK